MEADVDADDDVLLGISRTKQMPTCQFFQLADLDQISCDANDIEKEYDASWHDIHANEICCGYRQDLLEMHKMEDEDAEYYVLLYTPRVNTRIRQITTPAQVARYAHDYWNATIRHMEEEKKTQYGNRSRKGRTKDKRRHGRE